MASITSVISLFVLLLVTYCYSVPIGHEFDMSKSKYEFTTDKTMIGRETKMDMDTDDESTDKPHVHEERKIDEHDSDEYTTPSHFEKHDDESHHKRRFEDSSFTTPDYEFHHKRTFEDPLFTTPDYESHHKRTFEDSPFTTSDYESHHERSVEDLYDTTLATDTIYEKPRSLDDYLFTTLESSAKFNARAFPRELESGEVQTRDVQPEKELEMTTSFESLSSSVEPDLITYKPTSSSMVEPESSIDSFGKSTGLLHNDEPEEKSTTPEYKTIRSTEQPSTRFPVDKQRVTQTETIIPGKITETKIFANSGSRTYIVSEPIPVKHSQLNQDRT